MALKNNNWLNYLLAFMLMLLPLQNGMAAVNSMASSPVQQKQVCHEMSEHGEHHAMSGQHGDMQQHPTCCCDKDKNCQHHCSDCKHCPAVSVIPGTAYKSHFETSRFIPAAIVYLPDTSSSSLQYRPPRV